MDESVILEGGGWQVGFHYHRDRYAHTIGLLEGARLVPLLASVEGAADQIWPPSPSLQNINVDEGRNVALLVGMAGRSHWSVSIEFDNARRAVDFDVACRIKQQPPPPVEGAASFPLGSGYRTMVAPQFVSPVAGQLQIDGLAVRIEAIAPDSATGPAVLAATSDGLRVSVDVPPANGPRTIRWRYALRRA